MANITVTTAANLIPEVWGPPLLFQYETATKMRPLVWNWPTTGQPGDTIHVPVMTKLTADTKSASTALTPVANTESKVDITLNLHKAKAVRIERIAEVQSQWDLVAAYARMIGTSIARAVDTSLATLAASADSEVDATTTTVANMFTKLVELKQAFDLADAPEAPRFLVVRPTFYAQMLQIDKLLSKDYIGNATVVPGGFVGSCLGFNVVMSNAIATSGANDQNLAFVGGDGGAIVLAMQKEIELATQFQALDLATDVVAHTIYGVKIVEQTGVRRFLTKTSAYTG